MKLIDLLCKASAVLDKFDRGEAFCASPSIQEYLDEHDRIQRISDEANRQIKDLARDFAAPCQQPISIRIQIEKER